MVDKNLSADITEATTIAATDLLYAVIGGNSRRIKLSNVFTSPVLVTPALGTPSSGVLTNVTGTASGLTAGNVTTNANLTGPITSVGNATSIASQTGTGTKFVVDTTPTLVTPILGVAAATSLAINGAAIGTNALAATGTANISGNMTLGSAAVLFWSTDAGMSRNAPGVMQFSTNAANAAGSWLATNGTLSGALTLTGVGSITMGGSGSIILSNSASSAVIMNNGGAIFWNTRVVLRSPADGTLSIRNNAETSAIELSVPSNGLLNIAGALTVTGITSITSTTDSTTTTSGSVQIAGGVAIRKRIFADGLTASAGLQTAVICQSSAGELIADSVACLASSERFKDILGVAEIGAIDKIIRVKVKKWKYRRDEGSIFPDNYYSEHIGPTAEDIEAIDSRLVGRDKEGKARSISTDQLLALAIQAIQEQQVQIEELRARAA